MPLQYPGGILSEHKHTRNRASLFDISHMGQVRVWGDEAASSLERLVPGDIVDLPENRQRYTVFTTPNGGVLDDFMVTNFGDCFVLVLNASRKKIGLRHLQREMPPDCHTELMSDQLLIALQGPDAEAVLTKMLPDAGSLQFLQSGRFLLDGVCVSVSRSGYTGEDGFEISLPVSDGENFVRCLLHQPGVAPAGLGARDSLRLEAGLCLYGHELDENISLVEAGLGWIVAKRYLDGSGMKAGFPGAMWILDQIAEGTGRRRVGLLPKGRAPIRQGAEILSEDNKIIGRVTSGGFGPTVGGPIAIGYVDSDFANPGSRLKSMIRKRPCDLEVVRLPFVAHKYQHN